LKKDRRVGSAGLNNEGIQAEIRARPAVTIVALNFL
jgi:hypothetical protein